MSAFERWMESARSRWDELRLHLNRLAPAPVSPDQLTTDDGAARWRALRALMDRPSPGLLPQLMALTADADPMMRAAAGDVLASWGPTAVLEPIHNALAQSPPPEQAAILLGVLTRLPDPANRDVIQPWLAHEHDDVRAAAYMALAALCDDADLSTLRQALREGDPALQRAILTTLCAPAAEPLAQRAADSRHPVLAPLGRQALARIQQQRDADSHD